MMQYDVIVIGGGAAGLPAALSASKAGARVLVLEAAGRVGRKILASGNGRCNMANLGPARYWGDEKLARGVLNACPPKKVLDFFRRLGLVTVEEDGGRVYPGCGQASAVLDVLREAAERRKIAVLCDTKATAIEKTKRGFLVSAEADAWEASAVVAAFGGMAGGKLGHDGSPYGMLTALGHTLVPPRPALTQLIAQKGAVKGLSGLRAPALLTLCRGETPAEAAQGEVLFTDYGVSGVCAMQLSRKAGELLEKGQDPVLYVNFSPMLGLMPRTYDRKEPLPPHDGAPAVLAYLKERRHMLSGSDLLTGMLPRLLAERLRGLALPELARNLAAYPVPLAGVKGFEGAQVTAGGIRGDAFIPDTLASKACPGLFAAGEMLDVDGDCGGFNLQFAFASGLIAGKSAAAYAAALK